MDCLVDGRRLVAKSSACAQRGRGWVRVWGVRTVCGRRVGQVGEPGLSVDGWVGEVGE